MKKVYAGVFSAKAALPQGKNPLPFFRDPNHDSNVGAKKDVPLKYQKLMGLDCGKRVLPYSVMDRYDRNRTDQEIPAIIMENEFLRATFLHTLGGRLISLWDKEKDKELLHANKSLQTANLGNLDAWFAGGIEWNIGQYGHAFSSSSKLFATVQKDTNGEDFLRLYDFEKCKGLWWHIDFHLPKNSKLLYAHVEVHNLYEKRTSMYYWTNIAVEMTDDTRIFASNKNAVYLDPFAPKGSRRYGHMKMPHMEIHENVDASYPNQFPYSNEYFFTCEDDPMPWETALEKDGTGFFEASTPLLAYRKMFCWGHHAGGKRWQRFLAPDTDVEYVEIQGGLACSQLHGLFIEGKSSMSWTQAFGALEVDGKGVHNPDFEAAEVVVQEAVESVIDSKKLSKMHDKFTLDSKQVPETILQRASGWGYLEKQLRKLDLPKAFVFDEKSVGDEEKPYLVFLTTGKLPVMDLTSIPYVAPICSKIWKERFIAALKNPALDTKEAATLKHYLGIIYLENEEVSSALTCWLEVMAVMPNAWTARNLAVLEQRRGFLKGTLEHYERATTLPGFDLDVSIAEEYCKVLVDNKMVEKARALFDSLPSGWLEKSEKLMIPRAQLAAMEGDAELIKKLVFDKEMGHIKEGEVPLNDLWNSYNLIKYTKEHKVAVTDELVEKVKKLYPLPAKYDLNMYQ